MVELLRALAAVVEPPSPALQPIVEALGIDSPGDAVAHADLFDFQLPPYASIYVGAEGMIGGEARDRIAGFWRVLGLDPPDEPDHLTVLLAFYARLVESETETRGERNVAAARQTRHAFFWEHLASWLPAWLAAVDTIGPPSYRQWAALLGEVIAREAVELGPPARLPLHLRVAPPLPDPRKEGAEAFLAALLAPVRSGLIVADRDLKGAAAELEVGIRAIDRRRALTSLVGGHGPEALRWIAELAERWADRATAPALEIVDGFWRARAGETAALARSLADG
jgi:hypothetical protein